MVSPPRPPLVVAWAGRVLELCGCFRLDTNDSRIRKAVGFLKSKQEKDGSWYGRWGVNYIYGTAHVLRGLQSLGFDMDEWWIQRGRQWLEIHQNSDGGWGESCVSYVDAREKGRGSSTASQTAWAIMGLCSFPEFNRASVQRRVAYLLHGQNANGSWDETLPTGTGFPEVIYLRHDFYRLYWPLRALAMYRRRQTDG
jgi:squalene-hopene/tetraprenyl-beta-curcumene cyclase